jgi:hypothetical protein
MHGETVKFKKQSVWKVTMMVDKEINGPLKVNLLHEAESFLRCWETLTESRYPIPCMESEVAVPWSQKYATDPYPVHWT